MDFKRSYKTRFPVALTLALIMLGLALHQHDPSHFETDHSCLICLGILHWVPAIFIAFALVVFRRLIVLRTPADIPVPRGPDFTHPPLRAPPRVRL